MRDHLALSGTCRALRACYDDVALIAVLGRRPLRVHGVVEPARCLEVHWPRVCDDEVCTHGACTCEAILGKLATRSVTSPPPVSPSPKRALLMTIHNPERSLSLTQASRIYGVRASLRDRADIAGLEQAGPRQAAAQPEGISRA